MYENHRRLFLLQRAIRDFFRDRDFLEVSTPPLVKNPGMETHLHPFQIRSISQNKNLPYFLHTSPEFHMKELLSEGFNDIFTMSYCFRDEPISETHNPQFLMLEWYKANSHYTSMMKEVFDLTIFCHQKIQSKCLLEYEEVSVDDLFQKYLNFSILNFLTVNTLKSKIKKDFKDIHLPKEDLLWEDYFFLLFLNKIEPQLKKHSFLLVKEFPAPLAALSTLKPEDSRVCERFEVYMNGLEICNCFNELTDIDIQRKRFSQDASNKKQYYNYQLPEPMILYRALEKGIPPSSGIALGVERLLMALSERSGGFYSKGIL